MNKGVRGLYVCGSSGECIYQSVAERKQSLEAVMSEKDDQLTVIAHVACNNTQDSVELARHAQACGVDAIASIPPIYFRLPEHAIARYWNAISDAAPDTDFVIYNIPQLAGVALTQSLFKEMLKNPRVVAVKNSSPYVQDIQMYKAAAGDDFIVFNGPDEQFLAGRESGAGGGFGGTYTIMPELYLKLDELFRNGEISVGQQLQQAIVDIITATVSCHGNMYAANNEILRRREDLDIGSVRAPLAELSEEDSPRIDTCCDLLTNTIRQYC